MNDDIKRIKDIINNVIDDEIVMRRMRHIDRLEHIKKQILFKIDNPDYIRKKDK